MRGKAAEGCQPQLSLSEKNCLTLHTSHTYTGHTGTHTHTPDDTRHTHGTHTALYTRVRVAGTPTI